MSRTSEEITETTSRNLVIQKPIGAGYQVRTDGGSIYGRTIATFELEDDAKAFLSQPALLAALEAMVAAEEMVDEEYYAAIEAAEIQARAAIRAARGGAA